MASSPVNFPSTPPPGGSPSRPIGRAPQGKAPARRPSEANQAQPKKALSEEEIKVQVAQIFAKHALQGKADTALEPRLPAPRQLKGSHLDIFA